jgi:hypothetical protein
MLTLTLSAGLGVQLLSLCALAADRQSPSANVSADAVKPQAAPPDAANSKAYRDRVLPYLQKYCIECHGRETH